MSTEKALSRCMGGEAHAMCIDKAPAILASAKLAAVREAMVLITRGPGGSDCGRRALLLAYNAAPEHFGSLRELARRLGVTVLHAEGMLMVVRYMKAIHLNFQSYRRRRY